MLYLVIDERGKALTEPLSWGEAVKVLKEFRSEDPEGVYQLKDQYTFEHIGSQ
jgi:hypothetical protein